MSDLSSDAADLPLDTAIRILAGVDQWHLHAVDELDLPSIMVADGPHGLRKAVGQDLADLTASVPATCFPPAVTVASTWDPDQAHRVGRAIGLEARAEQVGVVLGPGVNIVRHPRGGRSFEYFSEDPHLSGELAVGWIDGVQQVGVGASLKHYAVNNQERNRMVVDVVVDERTAREVYLRAFEEAVTRAQPWTVMTAYNRVNGTYCGEHPWLLQAVLRDEWGFDGLVVSDWGGNNDRVAAVAAGLDLEMPGPSGHGGAVREAVRSGAMDRTDVDRCADRVVSLIRRTEAEGRMPVDPPSFDDHHVAAREIAADGTILLANDGVLPIDRSHTIGVFGELAVRPRYQGSGSSRVHPTRLDIPLDELRRLHGSVRYAAGYRLDDDGVDDDLVADAAELAGTVDVAVVVVGLPPRYETEGADRDTCDLPPVHDALVSAVAAANRRTVVVLQNGAAVHLPWRDAVGAIVESHLGGQAAGGAVADVLTGVAEPGGRLPYTIAVHESDHAASAHFPGHRRQVEHREGVYVGYRWFDSAGIEPAFPFGHGLSYTTFAWSDCTIDAMSTDDDAEPSVRVCLTVENTGNRRGCDVVQVYVAPPESVVARPTQELRAFRKVRLAPGETTTVELHLDRRAFAVWSGARSAWVVPGGDYEIRVAASSRDVRTTASVTLAGDDRPDLTPDPEAYRRAAGPLGDADFVAVLGCPVPTPEPTRPFHRNSTLGEVAETRIGGPAVRLLQAAARRSMRGADTDGGLGVMVEHAIAELPLRNIAAMSGGRVPLSAVDRAIALLNRFS